MKQTMAVRFAAPALAVLAAAAAPGRAEAQDTARRVAPPAPLPARPIQFPAYTERTLPNGLRLIVVENHTLPVADVDLYVGRGLASEPAGKIGVADLAATLINKGTATRSALQIAEAIEGAGGSLGASSDEADVTVSVGVLSDQLSLAFEILSDVALNPTFPEQELETARRQALSALQVAQGQPGFLASRTFDLTVYGTNHPYGTQPTPQSVQGITRADLVAFHQRHFKPGNAMLVVSGDVTPARAEELARQYFGRWSGAAPAAETFPAPPAQPATRVLLVHRPGSVQSNLVVGHTGLRPESPDYWAVQVLNAILGGTGDSRLENVLRSQRGWTYGARSSFNRPRQGGVFQANTEVRTEVTDSALAELMSQLRNMRTAPPTAEELESAKSFLASSYPNRFETPGATADQIAGMYLLGLSPEQLKVYQDRVRAVTAADVQRVAQQYLSPDRAVIVVVGDATKVLPAIERVAPVTLLDVEGKPMDRAALVARAPTERFDGSRLQPVSLTYAVMFQGNAVGQATAKLTREGDAWMVASTAQAGPTQQTGELRFTRDLLPISTKSNTQLGGAAIDIDLRVANGRVQGTAKYPAQMGGDRTVDTELPAGARLQGMDSWLLAAADLSAGKSFTVPVFDPRVGSVQNITFRVTGEESVTVAAGTFQALRVETSGGEQPAVLFVRKDAPHIMVKQELGGQPVTIELRTMQ